MHCSVSAWMRLTCIQLLARSMLTCQAAKHMDLNSCTNSIFCANGRDLAFQVANYMLPCRAPHMTSKTICLNVTRIVNGREPGVQGGAVPGRGETLLGGPQARPAGRQPGGAQAVQQPGGVLHEAGRLGRRPQGGAAHGFRPGRPTVNNCDEEWTVFLAVVVASGPATA